jgi:DNA-binding NarL/FixJ family response regulator
VTHVLMVASAESFRRPMRELLRALPGVILDGEAVDGVGAVIVCALGRFDVVVIDAQLLQAEAREIVAHLRAVRPETTIVACATVLPVPLPAAPKSALSEPKVVTTDGPDFRIV